PVIPKAERNGVREPFAFSDLAASDTCQRGQRGCSGTELNWGKDAKRFVVSLACICPVAELPNEPDSELDGCVVRTTATERDFGTQVFILPQHFVQRLDRRRDGEV